MKNKTINQTLISSYSDDIPYFLKRVYAARNVKETDLELALKNLLKPNFKNLELALTRLTVAIKNDENILIVGDFDCDGATASVVAIKSLQMMGAVNVGFLVPNRFEHGYGLSPEIVKIAIEQKQPDLIITVDNGISSFDGVALANKHNIDVIVTDHHLPPEKLPNALAIINPNLKDCPFESKNIAGVGVCFYLMSALKTHLKKQDFFTQHKITEPNLTTVLDLVALGTIADVVKLDKNNRILINAGLQRIRSKKCSAGIIALFEIAKKQIHTAVASDIGFGIAPRLNAAGRMSDISYGIRCLLCDDINLARKYAQKLENLNQERRDEQQRMQEQADEIILNKFTQSDFNDFSISLFDKSWHEGIVGIVAGKLKEKYQVPSVVFASSNQEFLKGSIRSIPAVHIKDLLDLLDRGNPNLIEKFGGHAMAAGLVIKSENFEEFSKQFELSIQKWLDNQKPQLELLTDGELESAEICFENAQKLKNAGPWGQGFEEPIYQGSFKINRQDIIAEKHLRLYLETLDTHQIINAIAFNQVPFTDNQITLAYQLNINDFRGNQSLQLMIKN